jgi:hypothetical protein
MLLQESMHNVGYHITRGHKNVYMIQEVNLFVSNFKQYYKIVTSEMCALVPKNPQSNAICKRMHQTVGNVLGTLLHGEPPQNISDAKEFVDKALSIAMHAMRAGVHSTLGTSSGSLVFNRYMFLNIPLIADSHAITQKREHLIHENLIRENQKRRRYDYLPGPHVLKKLWKLRKLDTRTSGPYRVLQTHVNGTVTIELRLGVSERLNRWRVIPYKE